MTHSEQHDVLGRAIRKVKRIRLIDTRQLWEQWEVQHLEKLLPLLDVDCVFDVGANTGQYARMLRRRAGYTGRIISFEPIPEAAAQARAAAADDPLWEVEELALAEADGDQEFHVMVESQFSSLSTPRHDETQQFLSSNETSQTVTVRTERLATAFRRLQDRHGFERPYLKLDTQGYDVAIVRASSEIVPAFVALQSELAVKKLYDDSVDFRDALALYESLGFELSAFVPNNGAQFPLLIETDCVMVRSDLVR